MREMENGGILLKPEERDLKAYQKYCSTLTIYMISKKPFLKEIRVVFLTIIF